MKIVKEFVCREIVGEYILVPTGKTAQELNGMINLNATAHFVWLWIEKAESLEDLAQKMTEAFEIDFDVAKADAEEFIQQLLALGFVEYSDANKKW